MKHPPPWILTDDQIASARIWCVLAGLFLILMFWCPVVVTKMEWPHD